MVERKGLPQVLWQASIFCTHMCIIRWTPVHIYVHIVGVRKGEAIVLPQGQGERQ